ncbi:hypothetical protein [Photobacterium indicum]|uniref:hypothetical protein n=1 Tax=Photobacterium indicum TaxID=81447 RepID=UPI003D13158B
MEFLKRQYRLRKLIRICFDLEFDIYDDNVKACIIAVLMCEDVDDNNLEIRLMATYKHQQTIFILALENTREFQYILNLLNFELNNPHYNNQM